jgi:putative transposase
MTEKYQNKYRIPSARLQSWDYGSNAAYFITICTVKRNHFLGQIINGKMNLSEQGKLANQYWLEIPDHFSFVSLDEFIVMPNHMHGIIIINKPLNNDGDYISDDSGVSNVETGHALSGYGNDDNFNSETGHALSLQSSQPAKSESGKQPHHRFRNQGKNTISSMVGSFKSAVTKRCNENNLSFGWQSRFHDHIIRDNDEFNRIRNYITSNPENWEQDKFFKNDF